MKKILFIIFALVVSALGFAQREGDKIVITAKNGTQTEYQLTGNSNAMSSLSFDTDKMEVYLKGLEAFGAWQTFAIDDISNVSFSVYKESDVTDITLTFLDAAFDSSIKATDVTGYVKDNIAITFAPSSGS